MLQKILLKMPHGLRQPSCVLVVVLVMASHVADTICGGNKNSQRYHSLSTDCAMTFPRVQMFQTLYGQTAADLYAKAAGQNAQARQLYNASADTY
jgi:hypothetical protein